MRQLLTDLRGNPIYSFAQRRLRRMRHHPSTLMCLIQNRSWDEVLRRIRKHPSEALHQDEATGNTPLHIACRLEPTVAVVKALHAASRIQNHAGATPLHIAASHRCSAACMKALIECASLQSRLAEGKQVSPTADLSRMGRAPIHYACMSFRGLELDAFKLLFEESLKEGHLIPGPDEKRVEWDEEFTEIDFEESMSDLKLEVGLGSQVNVLGMKDATGQTPLALLFRRYRERVKVVIRTVDRLHRQHKDTPNKAALAAAMTVHADLGELWERAGWIIARLTEERLKREGTYNSEDERRECRSPGELVVSKEAASWAKERCTSVPAKKSLVGMAMKGSFSTGTDDEGSSDSVRSNHHKKFRVVHASVGLTGYGCPPEMIRLALSLHPHQVREMDENGNLPIHIAATASSFMATADNSAPNVMAAAAAAAADAGADDVSVLSEAMSFFSSATVAQTTDAFDKVIKLLLDHYPEGARIPHGQNGSLPLVLAIEQGVRSWEDGLGSLMNAYPPALHSKKIVDPKLYPRVLALVANPPHQSLDASFDNSALRTPRNNSSNKKQRRQEVEARTTLFQLLRARPDMLTLGYCDDI